MLCPPGYVCGDGTGLGQAYRTLCPLNYYCPTGTANNFIGSIAGDSINRRLSIQDANPYYEMIHVKYLGVNDVRIISTHNKRCFDGVDEDLALRYDTRWLSLTEGLNNPYISYLNKGDKFPYQNISVLTGRSDGKYYRPEVSKKAVSENLKCARDHKWDLINQAIYRKECNCTNFIRVVTAVYRLWMCTGSSSFDQLGLGAINPPYKGGRDYWFPDRTPKKSNQCVFSRDWDDNKLKLMNGSIEYDPLFPSIGVKSSGLLNLTDGVYLQRTWTESKLYPTYKSLKEDVEKEFDAEYNDLSNNVLSYYVDPTKRVRMDPYIFDLYWSIKYIEEFGRKLEDLIWLENGLNSYGNMV